MCVAGGGGGGGGEEALNQLDYYCMVSIAFFKDYILRRTL